MSIFADIFGGCSHKNTTFPQSPRRGKRRTATAFVTDTYIVCTDCGKEFAYDWQKMRVVTSRKAPKVKFEYQEGR